MKKVRILFIEDDRTDCIYEFKRCLLLNSSQNLLNKCLDSFLKKIGERNDTTD